MRLWISVSLPLLPLETYRPRWAEPGVHVLLEQDRVLIASSQAIDAGVRTGMKRAGVLTLYPETVMHERDEKREQAALDSVALVLLQYTPEVAAVGVHGLVMDVSASLRAFGGLRMLFRRVRMNLLDLGFTTCMSMAPTAQGAWLLAQSVGMRSAHRRALRIETLTRRLNQLPSGLLSSLYAYQEWLAEIGCKTIGALRKLPRAGLRRRCSEDVLNELDRAYGQAPELFNWITVPETFSARLELPDRIEQADSILFAARRLILQMTGWLVARQQGVVRFLLTMEHERGRQAVPASLLEITLAEAAWQETHLTSLLKERLARIQLAFSVIGLRLEATQTDAMLGPSESLFPEPGRNPADFKRLLELLTARLGSEALLVPALHADHRPEICNRWLPATTAKRSALPCLPYNDRPFWILEEPIALTVLDDRPFYRSPLLLISTAERIECGWWDNKLAVRDYFIAQGAAHTFYWVYRERLGNDSQWYLHGLFA